jgi:hypothetical protein
MWTAPWSAAAATLTSAGAAEVYRDPAGLLAALDGSLLGSGGEAM